MSYDSRVDTYTHIAVVRGYMSRCVMNLIDRMMEHDASKLEQPELEAFDIFTPKLAGMEYGSEEYKESIRAMGEALEHHYSHNRHHPEHWPRGIRDMSLLDLLEMLCDWRAAGQRHDPPSDLRESIEKNKERFGYSEEIQDILMNTAHELGMVEPPEPPDPSTAETVVRKP